LKQNVVGIGILWKYGYYDQIRKADQSMDALFQEKLYSFLEDTEINNILADAGIDMHIDQRMPEAQAATHAPPKHSSPMSQHTAGVPQSSDDSHTSAPPVPPPPDMPPLPAPPALPPPPPRPLLPPEPPESLLVPPQPITATATSTPKRPLTLMV